LIHVSCIKCRRRFELDPVWVAIELRKLKTRNPRHYQAHCPACQAITKVSVEEMRKDLDAVAGEVETILARQDTREETR